MREKAVNVTITLKPSVKGKAKKIALELLGAESISRLFVYWINKYEKEHSNLKID